MFLNVIIRTIVIYITVLVVMRLMGKREVGQLSTFDLVVAIMIAEIAVFPMEDLSIPLYMGLIPMFILAGMEILIAYIVLRSRFLRGIIEGSPSVLISGGKIIEREMRKQRYNINDLLGQLREHKIFNVADVEYAILETSGKLSVITKPSKRPVIPADMGLSPPVETIPAPIILDGEVIEKNLYSQGLSPEWLKDKLQQHNLQPQDILFASLDSEGKLYISEKEKKKASGKS
ncbi:MAG: DUF421 domain-containing protein [Bacillota bacterium]